MEHDIPKNRIDERTLEGFVQSMQLNDGKIKRTIQPPPNILLYCPHCNADKERLIHSGKKWRCLDCFKSFKTPIYKPDETINTTIPQPIHNQLQAQLKVTSQPLEDINKSLQSKKPKIKWNQDTK